ncbi:hypothetical protein H634G_08181 [Metarhizium anisopliae BRIP 53293]|uniref:Uncharacterized protein n=2 Tax=Clavicipitaceae TaxID=34397 RepID=A0A179F8S9_METCM|nr:hypothetical protein VFPPC_16563 [Pochonia chlamydosporia 170]KJK76593.1 hypothetical protein H634G_08181 [Metarhizium anisopliae BRIP 53293]KJK87322.1 hypothetical protein H633G_08836 [Metarhizium anisopliae BRIP 53284]OAQ61832.1 hypothetical protein VFPPC_16563 [Pochonia chlamydosporia 170]
MQFSSIFLVALATFASSAPTAATDIIGRDPAPQRNAQGYGGYYIKERNEKRDPAPQRNAQGYGGYYIKERGDVEEKVSLY